jgi:hypothetical protein
MLHHIWTVLCTRSITNAETNSVTLFEVPEELTVYRDLEAQEISGSAQTNVLVNFDLVTFWEREKEAQPAEGKIRFLLVSPVEETINQAEYDLDLKDSIRSRLVIRIPVVTVSGSGTYRFQLEFYQEEQWKEVASIPLVVKEELISTSSEEN